MLLYLILAFTLIPFVELWLLLQAAATFGAAKTLALCLVTGVVGGTLARREGAAVLLKLQQELAAAKLPGMALIEAALVFAGGLLLLTPGIATDAFGFAMVVPYTRKLLAQGIATRAAGALQSPHVQFRVVGSGFGAAPPPGPRSSAPGADLGPNLRRIE